MGFIRPHRPDYLTNPKCSRRARALADCGGPFESFAIPLPVDALLKSVARREVDMVAAWAVDRLGSSLTDLLEFLRELHAKGVDLFLHQQGLDTSTPSGRAMFQMMGVFAEFERP